MYVIIIIKFCLNPLGFNHLFPATTASFTIKVVYNHTRIATYRCWSSRSAGQLRIRLLVLDGRSAKLAGDLPSGPILSGLSILNAKKYKIQNRSQQKRLTLVYLKVTNKKQKIFDYWIVILELYFLIGPSHLE